MPYSEHSTTVNKKPNNINQKIWRYFKLEHFHELVENHVLYFSRTDKLGEKFEGSLSQAEFDVRKKHVKAKVKQFKKLDPTLTEEKELHNEKKRTEYLNSGAFVNCWHMNDFENNLMWMNYSTKQKDVVIKSTFKRLCDCFKKSKYNIHIGKIDYKDMEIDKCPRDNEFHRIFRKHITLKDEKELRAVMYNFVDENGDLLPIQPAGFHIDVDLDILIEKIIISPFAERSIKDKIILVIEKNNLKGKLEKSSYDREPIL